MKLYLDLILFVIFLLNLAADESAPSLQLIHFQHLKDPLLQKFIWPLILQLLLSLQLEVSFLIF